MNKKAAYILVILVIIGLWTLLVAEPSPKAPTGGMPQGDDTTGAINQDLNTIMVDDANFGDIDADLKAL